MYNKYGSPLLLPTELGYYDLLDPAVRKRQGILAKEYGIDGFIYHHYWFHHKSWGASLNGALDKMLIDGYPDLPFALNWAPVSWTNTWNGKQTQVIENKTKGGSGIQNNGESVLVEQLFPDASSLMIEEHYAYLRSFFHHKNYILVNGCPLFFVYRKSQNPRVLPIVQRLQELAIQDGFLGLHIPATKHMNQHIMYKKSELQQYDKESVTLSEQKHNYGMLFYPYCGNFQRQMALPKHCLSIDENTRWKENLRKPTYVGVQALFDNTPRRDPSTATIENRLFFSGGPVESFKLDVFNAMLYEKCCQMPQIRNKGGKFILINAWNEWGEGMALEPSNVYGRGLLKAVKEAKQMAVAQGCQRDGAEELNR
jgi:hypothetical protein